MQESQRRLRQKKSQSRYSVTAYASSPVSLTEMKDHLKVDGSDENDYIEILIRAATEWVEQYLNRFLITRTVTEYFDSLGETYLRFPVLSLTSVQYYDEDNAQQTLSSNVYDLDTVDLSPRFFLADGQSFPDTYNRLNSVTFTYTSGYGAASAVPKPIHAAIYLMVADMFEQREDSVKRYPTAVTRLLSPYRILVY